MTVSSADLLKLFKRCIEIAMPDFRRYYRMVKKAEIVKTYSSDGRYWADVQPLLNDESPDPLEPVVVKVEIPVIWGGPDRGVVCPPAKGTRCDLSYYDGDPDFPRISNFRWFGNNAPQCGQGGFIIQLEPGVSIQIDPEKNIIDLTTADRKTETGGNKTEKIGKNKNTKTEKSWTIIAGETASITAPSIKLSGNITSTGKDGKIGSAVEKSNKTHEGSYTLKGNLTVSGSITASGDIIAGGSNSNHHSHP